MCGSPFGLTDYFTISPASNGSPHSGQNFGAFVGSACSHPHLSHLYCGTPSGFFAPHSEQNLPLLTAPQAHFQPADSTGFGLPHSGQNLPVAVAPQEHFQLFAEAVGCAC